MRTLKEKYEYNDKRKKSSDFSRGYCFGVTAYREYARSDAETRSVIRDVFSRENGFARDGDRFSKGVMCGVRDAANERKSKGK